MSIKLLLVIAVLKNVFNCVILVSPPSNNKEDLLNWCLDSHHHKSKPGKEANLFKECTPWTDRSCCTKNVTQRTHDTKNQYNFNLDHCLIQVNQRMSEECKKYFRRDLCFYECEPSIGLWIQKTNRSFAKERFFKVPLCESECNRWWDACKLDHTCVFNWPRDFKWKNRQNVCPENSTCITFKQMYGNAATFCEAVWDHSWEVTNDNKPCMVTWFEGRKNPNTQVAEHYIDQYFNPSGSTSISSTPILTLLVCVVVRVF